MSSASERRLSRQLFRLLRKEARPTRLKWAAHAATIITVLVTGVGIIVSNCNTQRQLKAARGDLELRTRPYLSVAGAKWSIPTVLSGDTALVVSISISNTGERPARGVRIKKDVVINIHAPRDRERIAKMSIPSSRLNVEQNRFWENYIAYRGVPVREMAGFFRQQWNDTVTEREIEAQFNQRWRDKQYTAFVLGPVKWRQAKTLPPGPHPDSILLSRSISLPRDVFTRPGGNLFLTYVIVEYGGLLKDLRYELHYIGFFDSTLHSPGTLAEFDTWDEGDRGASG